MSKPQIAVIGAGMAGLACAQELERGGADVIVYEKSRGLGGRMATRRQNGLRFDHGAQYVTARSRPFTKYIETAKRSGNAIPWKPSIAEDQRHLDAPFEEWLVGHSGMSSLLRPMAQRLRVKTGTRVHEITRSRDGWLLETDAGRERQTFDAVAVAVPAPQALTLLTAHSHTFRRLTMARMTPCWSVMVRFDSPPPAGADVHRWTGGPIAWAACDSTKPGRQGNAHAWVLHGAPSWSQAHLEADAQEAARLLLREFSIALGQPVPAPAFLSAHRWRYAQVGQPLELPCVIDEDTAAGACGDWCIAPRVEGAFESGRSLARALISIFELPAPGLLR